MRAAVVVGCGCYLDVVEFVGVVAIGVEIEVCGCVLGEVFIVIFVRVRCAPLAVHQVLPMCFGGHEE